MKYTSLQHIFIRTPLLPLEMLNRKAQILNTPLFQEALYLASPDLTEKSKKGLESKKKQSKLNISIDKYFYRMTTRPTPFGLFAGCSIGEIGDRTSIILDKSGRRFTRLDMQYLCALIQHFESKSSIREKLKLYPNDSIYVLGDKIRYIEYHYKQTNRIHIVSSVDNSEYLANIIEFAKKGATVKELIILLLNSDPEINHEDAKQFVFELLDNQTLKTELDPCVVGGDVLETLIVKMKKIDSGIYETLNEIKYLLTQIDNTPIGHGLSYYEKIMAKIKNFEVAYDRKYLFQADMMKPIKEATLSAETIEEINQCLIFLAQFNTPVQNSNLMSFKDKFLNKYESQEIPLSIALDGESGIGYPYNIDSGGTNSLIDDIVIPHNLAPQQTTYSAFDIFILKKIIAAEKNKERLINIKDTDFKKKSTVSYEDMATAISVMFCLTKENGRNKIFIKSAGGVGGSALIGRFCYMDERIENIAIELAKYEFENRNDALFVELSHMPESRVGNVTQRPLFRDYLLHYLSNTDQNIEKNIDISDIMISVKSGRVYLRSNKHNKEIIPRLSCAHNFSQSPIPIYRFLCDMQFQDQGHYYKLPIGDIFSHFNYMPRIEYRNVILNKERWVVEKSEIEKCHNMNDSELHAFIEEFITKRNLLRYVVLPDGDNEMFVDLLNSDSFRLLLDIIKSRPNFILEEFIFSGASEVTDNEGMHLAHEIITFFHKSS